MSRFMPACPKCNSLRVSLTRDITSRWGSHMGGKPIFHCDTCGKQIYGDAAEAEVARQLAAYEAKQAEIAARRPPRFLDRSPVAGLSLESIRAKLRTESNVVALTRSAA